VLALALICIAITFASGIYARWLQRQMRHGWCGGSSLPTWRALPGGEVAAIKRARCDVGLPLV